MATVIVKRPVRRPAPDLPSGNVILDSPPENPDNKGKNWTRVMMVLPMLCMMGGMILMIGAGRGVRGPIMYIAGGLLALGMLGMIAFIILNQASQGPSKQETMANRRRYMRTLSQLRTQVRETINKQRAAMFYRHPDPDRLWSTVQSARLWERRPGDWDHTVVRIGLGPQELATPLTPPNTKPVDELEPLCAMALRRFVTTYSTVPDLPVAVALRGFARIYVTGDTEGKRAFARAMVAQLAVFHAPGDVLTAYCVHPEDRSHWEWAKWIPHALHPTKHDAVGQLRMVAPSVSALEAMLEDIIANRPRFDPHSAPVEGAAHLVVFLDGGKTDSSEHLNVEGGLEGVTVLNLVDQPPRLLDPTTLVLNIAEDGALSSRTMDGESSVGRADSLDVTDLLGIARGLGPLRLSALSVSDQPLSGTLELADLLGLGDPYEFSLSTTWSTRSNRDRLRVPIGIHSDGRPMEIDLKESAQDGMGPHGLLVGATGSGKSELLRTLVLSLAVTHDPEILNFVLTDFKGGATFTKLDQLPHTSAVITNLADELHLVDRMLDAIQGELQRRQELLRKAGNYASQRDYEKARTAGAPLDPLPALLVIVDEFSELLTARPDFIDMFVQIGRVGRSLGVHLLLASQRLDEGKLRGLESHLSYRIALRTFSAMESRTVLGSPDAHQLPRSPGNGFLKTGTEELTRFKSAYVSGVHHRGVTTQTDSEGRQIDPVQDYSTKYLAPKLAEDLPEKPAATGDTDELGETLLDVMVGRMIGQGRPAHQVWLPPLAEPPTLDQLLDPLVSTPDRGLTTNQEGVAGTLRAVAGIIDKPYDQLREPHWLDLSGAGGNVIVIGGPQSGKSTILRSIVASLALLHTPQEAQFFCLDFGGGGLTAMRDLAHVGGTATRRETDRVRRSIAEAASLLAEREERFSQHGIDSMYTYRRMLREGKFPEDRFGDLFLVVDGWMTLRTEFEDLEPVVTSIVNRGLGFGIHVVAASNRWMDLKMNMRDIFGTRVELRLGDPTDSMFGRRQAMTVPEQTPGRGLTPDGYHFLSAVPRIDQLSTDEQLAEGVKHMVAAVNEAWQGSPAPRVRLLPAELPFDKLPPADADPKRGLPIGISERDLGPVYLNFEAEPHALVFGDVECGKSSFLRSLAAAIMQRYSPAQAQIAVIDYRRSLLGLVPDEYLIGYATNSGSVTAMVNETVGAMTKRLPGDDITPEQLKKRDWWSGPELFVLVDDYDLVATNPHDNPMKSLLEFMTQGRDIGLHLVVTRRSGGASRAMFDPVLSRIRDLASPGILMSGNKEEGPLLGNRKAEPLPPGRGWLITRAGGHQLVQLAHTPPAD
ncbi:S-DNA-T family DNA segregation ATPase FtsK/SpoIIIE [Tamaricihabitans halophyticus]|uniref:S-DNA-T family DNA segregation ATPase FtsK/SpoIIIE n=1 Tax=Tamaricihabitans halophyticus TaxID=1262583 RepID=A0A4R2QWF0_9PSEU|nr:type VII secretion protein EccCa [Tamaricihabitans halophyticus]TCP53594.1 S-DNA-T family DNA segregation ATPase FtsK/SpoIIIE [Tamaricihabitans halophyticus]